MAALQCPECGWSFLRESALREHCAVYHRDAAPAEASTPKATAEAGLLPPPSTPEQAGWYANPAGDGTSYWDGSRWVDTTIPPDPPVSRGWLLASYVASVVLPIAGLLAGIVVFVRGMRGHGLAVIAISIAIGAAGFLITSSDDSGGGSADDKVDRILENGPKAADRCVREAGSSVHALNRCIHDAVR
jgi:hypothetical protein